MWFCKADHLFNPLNTERLKLYWLPTLGSSGKIAKK